MSTLDSLAPDIWIASGADIVSAGFRYPTRMTVIRLSGERLFICSPVAPTPDLVDAVNALGQVAFIVAPNSLHYVHLEAWSAAFPAATLYAAPGLLKRAGDRLARLTFVAELGDTPPPDWSAEIDQTAMTGCAITTEIVFFHRKTGVVVFTDLLQNFPRGWFSGVQALIAKLDGMIAPEPQTPKKFRLAFTDRKAARASLARILAWPSRQVVMAHGDPVRANAPAFLARAFRWLSKT